MMCSQASVCSKQELQAEINRLGAKGTGDPELLRSFRAMYFVRFGGPRPE